MIQIIAGTFGYYNGRKLVPLTNESGPQQLDPELEARLVKSGVAEYVGKAKQVTDPPQPDPAGAPAPGEPEYSKEMKLEELKRIAALYEVDAAAMRKKDDVIAAIEAAKEKRAGPPAPSEDPGDGDPDGESGDGNEAPPQLGAQDPV